MTVTGFVGELLRRGLARVAALYAIFAWLLLRAALWICPNLDDPESALRGFALVAVVGLPVTLWAAWFLTGEAARPRPRSGRAMTAVLMLAVVVVILFESPGQSAVARARAPVVADVLPVAYSGQMPLRAGGQPLVSQPDLHAATEGLRHGSLEGAPGGLLLKMRGLRVETAAGGRGVQAELLLCTRVVRTEKQRRLVQIEAWLINTADGVTIWSERYEGDADDLDGLHEKLFQALREGMQVTLPGSSEGQIVFGPQPEVWQAGG